MRKIFLVSVGLVIFLVGTIIVNGAPRGNDGDNKNPKITIEQAREIALKKVPGTVEDEFPYEEESKIVAFVFIIRDAKKKVFEVQIDPITGKIISVAEEKE